MNEEIVNAFKDAVFNVVPMLGISDVKFIGEENHKKQIASSGVISIIGIIGDLTGNVFLSMEEECAKKIASYMMFGMEVVAFDELAQSAISELSNMLAANASISLSETGKKTDISTPTLMTGEFTVISSLPDVISLSMLIEDMPFNIYLSIKEK
ncbi:chemotaxis protein CheX [Anaerotignum propionicum]|uniref:CheY-P phosphatase CheX n=1 Tax=Anaerotignum propionicum DSM 1682 TaxID=991789 RepID=A0A0X1U7B8_ANAPI|nr:chemotaxis protein CheX [Anaerotignum propionicum]AMJ40822.1 CheY-P phosphatase CheX [Anaerotignum propionicum DSM 1682]MEA5055975.1 chemotaxis protein CheX [Anaerotignum propionicum]SHE74274.1 chemotaxis protein CheX [[Clostridium] propionicum DSM 1682] [Anaerotignum propionicum DSM 1682]